MLQSKVTTTIKTLQVQLLVVPQVVPQNYIQLSNNLRSVKFDFK